MAWWPEFLKPLLRHPKGSSDRAAAKRALAGKRVCGPDGVFFEPSLRDIERKLLTLKTQGAHALRRKERSGKGERQVTLTRRWDAATSSLSQLAQERIARLARQRIKDLWANHPSYGDVRLLASEYLADLTSEAGVALSRADLKVVCELPKHVVEASRRFRNIHEKRTNAKAWQDKLPRMKLTSAGLEPMQIVYGDVHHYDIYLRRDDGSLATPKGIAWLDAANRRVRIDLVLCEVGTGIRNADLIDSFISMTQDPLWGMPARFYLDNGSEYRFADLAKDALKLAGLDCVNFGGKGQITRAQAYNAAAKGILEGSFRVFEQTILSVLPGYIGGDRMKTRSGNVGKAPQPYPGDFDHFCARLSGMLAYWMSRPQQGDLQGRSPKEAFDQAVGAGWQRTDIDPHDLMMAFSEEGRKKVTKSTITVGKRVLFHERLFGFSGEHVRVRLPKHPEQVYRRDDTAGAVEAGRRKKAANAVAREMAAEVNPLDVAGLMIESASRQAPSPVPRSKGKIAAAEGRIEAGRQILETPEMAQTREVEEAQRHLKERLALAQARQKRRQGQ